MILGGGTGSSRGRWKKWNGACRPIARPFDKEKLLQLKVLGMERVTVPAGTFDSYKVELTSADAHTNKPSGSPKTRACR